MTDRLNDAETGPAPAGPASAVPPQLHSRRLASLRTPPLPCGPHRDPELHAVAPPGRSTYGLNPGELRAETNRLTARGWSAAEVAARLNLQEVATA